MVTKSYTSNPYVATLNLKDISEKGCYEILTKIDLQNTFLISKSSQLQNFPLIKSIPLIYGYSDVLYPNPHEITLCSNIFTTLSEIKQPSIEQIDNIVHTLSKIGHKERALTLLLLPLQILLQLNKKHLSHLYESIPNTTQCIILPGHHSQKGFILKANRFGFRMTAPRQTYPHIKNLRVTEVEKNEVVALDQNQLLSPIEYLSQELPFITVENIYRFALMESSSGQYAIHSIIGEHRGNLILRYNISSQHPYTLIYPYPPKHISEIAGAIKDAKFGYQNAILIICQDLVNLMLHEERISLKNILSLEKVLNTVIIIVVDTFIDLALYREKSSIGWILYRW